MANEIRTYELFDIEWDGSTWTGYHTAEEAQATVDFAAQHGGRIGHVVRRTFSVEIEPRYAHLYQPGI